MENSKNSHKTSKDERELNKETNKNLEKVSKENVKTGVSSIMGYAISLFTAAGALFASKKEDR